MNECMYCETDKRMNGYDQDHEWWYKKRWIWMDGRWIRLNCKAEISLTHTSNHGTYIRW